MKQNVKPKILLIDDDNEFFELMKFGFEKYDLIWESTFDGGIDKLKSTSVDLILLDLALNGDDYNEGIPNLESIKKQFPTIPIIVISSANSIKIGALVTKKGADDSLDKHNYDIPEWKKVINDCLQRKMLQDIKIFISHSTKDEEFVSKLESSLKKVGVDAWVNNIKAGSSIIDAIRDGLEATDFVFVVITPDSIKSDWVKKEIQISLKLERLGKIKRLIPIFQGKCNIPNNLKDRLYIDFTNESKYIEKLSVLIEEINKQSKSEFLSCFQVALLCSHIDKNGEEVKKLISKLTTFDNIVIWTIDKKGLGSERDFIKQGLSKSQVAILVLNDNFLLFEKAKKITKLLDFEKEKGLSIIPVLLDECTICKEKIYGGEKLIEIGIIPETGTLKDSPNSSKIINEIGDKVLKHFDLIS